MCLSKTVKYLVCPSKLRVELSVYEDVFFSVLYMIFWNSINLAYVSQLGKKDLVSDYIFTSQRQSHSVPDMGFLLTFNYFVAFGGFKNRFTIKLTSSILMEIVTIPVVLANEFYFYMHHAIKFWLFKKIFELVYLFHIALKTLISY